MKSIEINRTHIDYQTNTVRNFKGTVIEGREYSLNYRDEETIEGIVESIFMDPDGDEMLEVYTPKGYTEFLYAKGIYSVEEIKKAG
jgi:hypothetical protein